MGTRADFYIGKGKRAKWLGSIGCDGYPDGIDDEIWNAKTSQEYRRAVRKFLTHSDTAEYATLPKQGWPWPWDNSQTTDYSYTWDNGFWISNWGSNWVSKESYLTNHAEWEKHEKKMERYYKALERYEAGERKTEPKEPIEPEDVFDYDGEKTEFPDMSEVKNTTMGKRSGLIVMS